MAKRHFKGYFETYLVGDESFEVEIRLSPYRRTTSLSLRKSGFVCNAPSRLPKLQRPKPSPEGQNRFLHRLFYPEDSLKSQKET